jgi:hypothetical protein
MVKFLRIKKYLVIGFLLLAGCYSGASHPVYVPVPVQVYGDTVFSEEEKRDEEEDYSPDCDCDNWDFYECDELDYESECGQEIEQDSYKSIYNPSTGETNWIDEIGEGVYMDYMTGEMYYQTDNEGYLFMDDAGELYQAF